jgi:AraC-like DNA-binding protein
MMTRVRSDSFNLDGVPEPDREGRWEEILSSTHVDMAVRVSSDRPDRPFRASVRRLWIDDLALVDAECDPCSGTRGRTRMKGAELDYVVVLINRSGRESVAQDDAAREMRAGDAVVWDSSRPARFQVWEPLVKRSLFIPRTALAEIGIDRLGVVGAVLPGGAPATELLTSYLDVLARTVQQFSATAVAAARNAALQLVMAALEPEPDLTAPAVDAPALRAVIGTWIERNVARHDLTPSAIALAHGVSVRTVHRVFEETGGTVGAFIRNQRLARARTDLARADEPITTIATRWGFSDPSHFTRAFRGRYGCSPSRYRTDGHLPDVQLAQ